MGSASDNVAKLKHAYRQWHESKGASVKAWLDLMVDDVRCYSIAAGPPKAEFTAPINPKRNSRRYSKGLLDVWGWLYYTTKKSMPKTDRAAGRAQPAWMTPRPATQSDTPKS